MRSTRTVLALALSGVTAAALVGCATDSAPAEEDGRISVVASTDVYADLAAAVGGDRVDVSAIIEGSALDPHSYEVTARDRLAIETADLVVANGGGYDAFVETVLTASDSAPHAIIAVEVLGLVEGDEHEHEAEEHEAEEHEHEEEHDGHHHLEGVDEHVWYDVHGMTEVAEAIAAELVELDPAIEADVDANLAALLDELEAVEARAAEIAATGEHDAVMTEPVAGYLLEEAGVHDVTPEGFAEAIEEGSDVSPALLADTLRVLENGQADVLVYNSQTAGAETERVRAAAEEAGVPVVDVAETLPEGESYADWMTANLDALADALGV